MTCNQYAAGAIAGALQAGNSPFTVHYNLTLMFYMNACQIQMDVNVDKVYTTRSPLRRELRQVHVCPAS